MYRMPGGIADVIALRSDWSILAMDYWQVLSEMHGAEYSELRSGPVSNSSEHTSPGKP
jgi:hypothetical protein